MSYVHLLSFFPGATPRLVITSTFADGATGFSLDSERPPQPPPVTSMLLKTSRNCGVIIINALADVYFERDLAQVIFNYYPIKKRQVSFSRYLPKFKCYVLTDGCTLNEKIINLSSIYKNISLTEIQDNILGYGLARYFLWGLMTRKYTLEILRNRYTEAFYKILSRSKQFSCFLDIFLVTYKGWNSAFIE